MPKALVSSTPGQVRLERPEKFAVPSEEQARLICASYERLLGEELIARHAALSPAELAKVFFESERVVVSHGTQSDPLFNYANRQGLRLWDMPLERFIGMPSRYSAEPGERGARGKLLADVANQGFSRDYCGVRISASGRRFRITGAVVFNLTDEQGRAAGQAATFSRWDYLEA